MAQYPAHRFKSRAHVQDVRVNMPDNNILEKPYLKWLTLFIASGTLLCCALPILLVTLGFGALVASLNYNIPGLVFLVVPFMCNFILMIYIITGEMKGQEVVSRFFNMS